MGNNSPVDSCGGDPSWDLPIGKDLTIHIPGWMVTARCSSFDVFDHPVLGQMLNHTVGFPKIGERPNHPFQLFFVLICLNHTPSILGYPVYGNPHISMPEHVENKYAVQRCMWGVDSLRASTFWSWRKTPTDRHETLPNLNLHKNTVMILDVSLWTCC